MHFSNSPFEDVDLEIVATLSEQAIRASIAERESQTQLHKAIREAVERGVSVDALSDASGFPPEQIRKSLSESVSV